MNSILFSPTPITFLDSEDRKRKREVSSDFLLEQNPSKISCSDDSPIINISTLSSSQISWQVCNESIMDWSMASLVDTALMHFEGDELIEKNEMKGLELLIIGTEHRVSRAMEELAKRCLLQPNKLFDHKSVYDVFRNVIEKKPHPVAWRYIGLCHMNGWGVDMSISKAINAFKLSSDLKDGNSAFFLGECYWFGAGVDRSSKVALSYYESAMDRGCVQAITKLGLCYLEGEVVKQDLIAARQFLNSAAEKGDAFAIEHLKRCFNI